MFDISSSGSVTYASFRQASPEEVEAAQGGLVYRVAALSWKLFCQTLGTFGILYIGSDLRNWQPPLPQKLADHFWKRMGDPEPDFIKKIESYGLTTYIIENEEKIYEAFFSHHRNDRIFKNSSSMKQLFNLLKEIYPDQNFLLNDMVMTCDLKSTRNYQEILHKALNQSRINESLDNIDDIASSTLESWNKEQSENGIEIITSTRLYASKVIISLLFGSRAGSKKLSESISFINSYLDKSLLGQLLTGDKIRYDAALKDVRGAIEKILLQENHFLFEESDLIDQEKRATIFTLLFTGHETTSALLNHIIWQLALDPALQEKLYNSQSLSQSLEDPNGQIMMIRQLFTESIREFTPSWNVDRSIGKENVCLEYRLKGEESLRKKIFYQNDIISVNIAKMAKKLSYSSNDEYRAGFVFGEGIHRCPGNRLAYTEITQFIAHLLENYTITTNQREAKSLGLAALNDANPIYIKLTPRV